MTHRPLQLGVAASVVIVAVVVYGQTLAPSITWQHGGADSGDLAAAVATLGVPHPPGYPTYVLAGYAWSRLPFGGDLAYRLNLFSAVGAALAAGLTALTVMQWRQWPTMPPVSPLSGSLTEGALCIGAGVAGLFLAFAPLVWSQATITEVYAPGLAALCLLNWLMLTWRVTPSTKDGLLVVLAGLTLGLGFGLLPQIVLVGPGLLLLLSRGQRPSPQFWHHTMLFLLGTVVGLSVFIYLPVRAVAQPFINWGNPSSPIRFWSMVTAAPYHHYLELLEPIDWLKRLGSSAVYVQQSLSWSGVGLAVLGGCVLWLRDRLFLTYLLSLSVLTFIFRTVYPVMGNRVYLLPALACLALLIGLGTAWLLEKVRHHVGQTGMIIVGLSLLITLAIRASTLAPQFDLSDDHQAAQFGQETLANLPPRAMVLSGQDDTTFSLWYRQALGQRPDVVVVDKRLLYFDWYRDHLSHHYPDLTLAEDATPPFASTRPLFELAGESHYQLSQSAFE
ncbi:MAG: DUF2723 domain-containing protein [Anaerolineae bacterium]|nr:DUF2723 domain-containing protein [Anaerolineae bacterium]